MKCPENYNTFAENNCESGEIQSGDKERMEEWILSNLTKNEAFASGVNLGINLYQKKVITAHERGEPVKVGENIFYLESGRERLARVLNEICK